MGPRASPEPGDRTGWLGRTAGNTPESLKNFHGGRGRNAGAFPGFSSPPHRSERPLHISAPHGRLEAHLRKAEGPLRGGAVVCHPHPQHGGTMHTKAVFRAAQALSEAGFHVLRFNFRGVGTSTGRYGEGVGEEEDVRVALDWMADREPDLSLLVGGFSFGARVGLAVGVRDDRVRGMLGMGLPLSMTDFSFLEAVDRPVLVVQGEEDEYGDGPAAAALLEDLGGRITLVRVEGSDHYFHDRFEELQEAVREYFMQGPGAEVFPERTDP